MRLIKQIPHEHFLVQIHQYNNKYILSITLDDYEQIFKVPTDVVADLDLLETAIQPAFYSACLQNFIQMRDRWLHIQQQIQQ
jgi:hypothetical protein